MPSRYAPLVEAMRAAAVDGPGTLGAAVRKGAFAGDVPAEARAIVEKIRKHAYKVTDEDIAALRTAGWSEDQIFELTICAAVGAGVHRLDAALRAIREAG